MHKSLRRMVKRSRLLVATLASALALLSGVFAADNTSFQYESPEGTTCTVTPEGLSSVKINGQTIAAGRWQLVGAPPWAAEPPVPSVTPNALSPGPVKQRTLSRLSDNHVRVQHLHELLTVTYDYVFNGPDLHIAARIENSHRERDVRSARFGGLTCNFGPTSNGLLNVYAEDELQTRGLQAFHPSPASPIGGNFAASDNAGLGLCPIADSSTPTLLWWEPAEAGNAHQLNYIVSAPTKADGAMTYQLLMRFTGRTDWKHLLTPWKRRLMALYGSVRYGPIYRPLAYHAVQTQPVEPAGGSGTTLWNCAPGPWGKSTNPDNPLGYADGEVRFDRAADVQRYVKERLPALQQANAAGIVFRQLGGYDPKGLDYAAIFHMAPPQVHENVKNLIAGPLKDSRMRLGVTGRPDRWPVHATIDSCAWLDAEPHLPVHLRHMWDCRLRDSIRKMGAGIFLMEDFGVGTDDLQLMQSFRQKMNEQDVPPLSFTAYPSDAMLHFSPGMVAIRKQNGEIQIKGGQQAWEICRWLVPGAVLYGHVESQDAESARKMIRFLYSHGMGAMVNGAVLPGVADLLAELPENAGKTKVFDAESPIEPFSPSATPPSALAGNGSGSPDEKCSWTTDGGIQVLITAEGLKELKLGDRTLAEGSWTTLSPGEPFNPNTIESQSLEKMEPGACRVIHASRYLRTTFDYELDGEDLTIRARVNNNHPSADIDVVRFGEVTFHFKGHNDRSQLSRHSKWGWLPHPDERKDMGHMHPGWANRIAGSYGADETYGVGATPLHTGLTRTLTNWQGSWGSSTRKLEYSAQKPIPAGGARTFYLQLRLSTNRDWRHLMVPYRRHFNALHGTKPRYKVDHRLATQEMISAPKGAWRSKSNPLGYNSRRRIDTPGGARKWAEDSVSIMKRANGKGPIVWAQCGYQPRGMLFRSDFDLLPQRVARNWPIIDKIFTKAGKRYGVTVGRAGAMNYRWRWETDNILVLDPENLGHMQSMARRYRRMIDRGVTMFYLDAFGRRLRAVKAMRYYRNHVLGPNILTYCEHPCDAILPYSGVRTDVRFSGRKGLHLMWGLDRFWYIMNWVMEDFGSQNYAGLKSWPPKVKKKVGEKFGNPVYERVTALTKEEQYRWMFRHRMGVLEARHKVRPEICRKVQEEFMTADGRWRDDIEPIHRPGQDMYKQEQEERQRKTPQEKEQKELDDLLGG